MDHSLLRSWLGLAPGPWPPDHYTLLGLSSGQSDPAAVEPLVLARMDRLREHQLLHPELVTEGMNRLAQALICLTDPTARAAYDAGLGLPPGTEQAGPNSTVRDPELLLDRPPELPPFEVIEEEPPEPLPPAYEVVWEDLPRPVPAYEVVEVVEAELVARPGGPWQPTSRRQLFARLARMRKLLAAWRELKPAFANPREPLSRPPQVVVFLEAVVEARTVLETLREVLGEPGKPGGLVTALLAQPVVLPTFRLLVPDQRRAVAIDWRNGEAALAREYGRLRELVRTGRPVRRRSRWRCRGLGWLVRTPELLMVLLTGVAIVLVWVRVRWGR